MILLFYVSTKSACKNSFLISWMAEKMIFTHSGQDLRISQVFARALLIYKYIFLFARSHDEYFIM